MLVTYALIMILITVLPCQFFRMPAYVPDLDTMEQRMFVRRSGDSPSGETLPIHLNSKIPSLMDMFAYLSLHLQEI